MATWVALANPRLEALCRIVVNRCELRSPLLEEVGFFVRVVKGKLEVARRHSEPGVVVHQPLLKKIDSRMGKARDAPLWREFSGGGEGEQVEPGGMKSTPEGEPRQGHAVVERTRPLMRRSRLMVEDRSDLDRRGQAAAGASKRTRMSHHHEARSVDA